MSTKALTPGPSPWYLITTTYPLSAGQFVLSITAEVGPEEGFEGRPGSGFLDQLRGYNSSSRVQVSQDNGDSVTASSRITSSQDLDLTSPLTHSSPSSTVPARTTVGVLAVLALRNVLPTESFHFLQHPQVSWAMSHRRIFDLTEQTVLAGTHPFMGVIIPSRLGCALKNSPCI